MKRTIVIMLIITMLLSALFGCGKDNDEQNFRIDYKQDSTIGNDDDDIIIAIPANTFGQDSSVSIDTIDIESESDVTLLSNVFEITEQNNTHNLDSDVTVKIKLPEDTDIKDCITLMGAYYDGSAWEYIEPDFNELLNGYLQFDTPHFSPFAAVKMDNKQAVEEYARKLAVQKNADRQEEKAVLESVTDYFNETFDAMGFTDKTAQGILMQAIAKESDFGSFIVAAKTGNVADFSGKAAELIAKATLKNMWSEEFTSKVTGGVGSIASGVAAGMEKVYDGDYKEAYKAFVSSAAEYFPVVRAYKATYSACQMGREMWVNYSVECGYKQYLSRNPSANGELEGLGSDDCWREIYQLMSSSMRCMQEDYRKAYAASNDMTFDEVNADKTLSKRLNAIVEDNLKKQYIQRFKNSKEIDAETAKIQKQIEQFAYYDLLDYDILRGWSSQMTLSERLDSLYRIRANIIELVGGDITVFGGNNELQSEALAVAINEWIMCGSDRVAFYRWLEKEGYLNKPKKPADKYVWKLVSSELDDGFSTDIDDYDGGDGYYYDLTCNPGSFTEQGKFIAKECPLCGNKGGHVYNTSVYVTEPPITLHDNEEFVISVELKGTASKCSMGAEDASFGASFGGWGHWFTDDNGKDGFRTDGINGYNELSTKIKYTIPSGSKNGETKELVYNFPRYGKYVFIYVWTYVG